MHDERAYTTPVSELRGKPMKPVRVLGSAVEQYDVNCTRAEGVDVQHPAPDHLFLVRV